ncbi:MAG: hypothetical protein WCW04_00750 [Candidatus Paceibacterota bacterium]
MKNINFKDNLLTYILTPLIIIVSIISFYRFFINHDYLIGYEGVCDPSIKKCFVGCEDDSCTKEYYYSQVIKYAPDLKNECGEDITDCETASVCLPNNRNCSITYCDPEIDSNICSKQIEEINIENDNKDNSNNSTGEDILQDNKIKE